MATIPEPKTIDEATAYLAMRAGSAFEPAGEASWKVWNDSGRYLGLMTDQQIIDAAQWRHYCTDGFIKCPYCGREFAEDERLDMGMQCAGCAGYTTEGA